MARHSEWMGREGERMAGKRKDEERERERERERDREIERETKM